MRVDFEISKAEALARLSQADELECRYELIPNDGVTRRNIYPRSAVLQWLERAPRCFESGPEGQQAHFGVYVVGVVNGSLSRLFLPTKPECQLSPQQLGETVERGRGADIFSQPIKH